MVLKTYTSEVIVKQTYPYLSSSYVELELPGGHRLNVTTTDVNYNLCVTFCNKGVSTIQLLNLRLLNIHVPVLDLQPYDVEVYKPTYYNVRIVRFSFDLEVDEVEGIPMFITNFADMQKDIESADAVLSCDGTEVHCHVAILAARSKHFREMFRQKNFVEGKTKRATIKDMSLATLNEMIKFIYSNNFNAGEATDVASLFSAAHLYDIPDLLSRCESIMMNNMTLNNAAEFFFRGFLTESNALKVATMDFISKNFEKVRLTDGWRMMKEDENTKHMLEDILSHATSVKKMVPVSEHNGHGRNFISNIRGMQSDVDFADVILCCDNTDIHCHIPILMARSQYFKRLFQRREESAKDDMTRVTIENISLATLKELIQFIYSNEFNKEGTDVRALFTAAHVYGIPCLMLECAKVMKKLLNIENAAEFFFKGFSAEADDLKKAAMRFILTNFVRVRDTTGWKLMMKNENTKDALEEILVFATANNK